MTKRKTDAMNSALYRSKRTTKRISVDMYLDTPLENEIYKQWEQEPNKKQLFIQLFSEHLEKTTLER